MSIQDPHAIPWKELIVPQLFNFTVFLSALIYLLKKPILSHFSGRRDEFEKSKKTAEEAKVAAERQNSEIKTQLKLLESTAGADLEKASVEAKALQEKILNDAKVAASKLEEETSRMAQYELQRAMNMLRVELIQNSTNVAADNLKANTKNDVRDALNDEFIKNVKAVY